MTIDRAIYTPLFNECSCALESPAFTVFPGEVAQIRAFGFLNCKVRKGKGDLEVPQAAFVEMLMFEECFKPPREEGCQTFDLKRYSTQLLARDFLRVCGNEYVLSRANNILHLNIPGSYDLVLNDPTAIGVVQVYLHKFTREEFPWNSHFLIG